MNKTIPLDVYESNAVLVIETDAFFGIRPETIDITASERAITIRFETQPEAENFSRAYLHRERRFGRFERRFKLPIPVDPHAVSAELKNGVLKIQLPKT